jgi:hypothetical protein
MSHLVRTLRYAANHTSSSGKVGKKLLLAYGKHTFYSKTRPRLIPHELHFVVLLQSSFVSGNVKVVLFPNKCCKKCVLCVQVRTVRFSASIPLGLTTDYFILTNNSFLVPQCVIWHIFPTSLSVMMQQTTWDGKKKCAWDRPRHPKVTPKGPKKYTLFPSKSAVPGVSLLGQVRLPSFSVCCEYLAPAWSQHTECASQPLVCVPFDVHCSYTWSVYLFYCMRYLSLQVVGQAPGITMSLSSSNAP